MTQFPREDNPPARQNPAIAPFHFDENGNPTKTGHNNPLPNANYIQTASGVWIPQKGSDDGSAHMSLTGRKVEEVFPREVRTTNKSVYNFVIPDGVKGFYLVGKIYSAIGTFGAGQGMELLSRIQPIGNNDSAFEMRSGAYFSSGIITQLYYDGEIGDARPAVQALENQMCKLPPGYQYTIQLLISGTFVEGEGIDCDAKIFYLL